MSSNNLTLFSPKDLRNRVIVLTCVLLIIGLVALYSISDNPLSIGSSFMRVIHAHLGLPFIYIIHEPHFPALQFKPTPKSVAC